MLTGVVCIALVAEIYLRFDYHQRVQSGKQYRSTNPYTQIQNLVGPGGQGLWEEPWKSYKPDVSIQQTLDSGELFSLAINRHGFRGSDVTQMKPANTLRIIAMGGSTTFLGLTDDATYPAYLQRELQSLFPERKIEVLNFGVSGTWSGYWVKHIDRVIAFEPDIVVHYNAINDIAWHHAPRYAKQHRWQIGLQNSYLYQKLFPIEAEALSPHFDRTLKNFRKLQQKLAAHNIQYLVGTFAMPDYQQASPEFQDFLDEDVLIWGGHLNIHGYENFYRLMQSYNHRLRNFAAVQQLPLFLLDEALFDPELFYDSCHKREQGQQIMAGVVAGQLQTTFPDFF